MQEEMELGVAVVPQPAAEPKSERERGERTSVVIIGAGVAGLRCALELEANHIDYVLLEAENCPGGRVRTDMHGGFRIDRGFQVYLTAYPECGQVLDLNALRLRCFEPGAQVWRGEGFKTVADPLRRPSLILPTLRSGIGTLGDKLRVAKLKRSLARKTVDQIFRSGEESTGEYLRAWGFSPGMIDGFFRPFFSGIFLEDQLETSSQIFEFVFKMFGSGFAALPANGIGGIALQMAHSLGRDRLQLETPVERIEGNRVETADGRAWQARCIVVATDAPTSAKLLRRPSPADDRQFRATTCLYFSAAESPMHRRMLALNGLATGLINNVTVPSDIQPSYAPPGRALISVSLLGLHEADSVAEPVMDELRQWFGEAVDTWKPITSHRIAHALPDFPGFPPEPRLDDTLYLCGDYMQSPSLEGAMLSGKRTGRAIASRLGG